MSLSHDPYSSDTPCVGIFWRVKTGSGGKWVSHVVSLDEADDYGDFLTHPSGHYAVWEQWQAAGPGTLRQWGLPAEIAWTEYEAHPRGRVVYHRPDDRFTIYVDQRISRRSQVLQIARLFGISQRRYVARGDSHYVEMPRL